MNLTPIIHKEVYVLTSKQLAEFYGTSPEVLSNNFNRNLIRFVEGKHYFVLQGEELKQYKLNTSTNHKIDESLNRLNKLYLWTQKGAARHANGVKLFYFSNSIFEEVQT